MESWGKFRNTIYSVSTLGNVRNDRTGKILNPYPNSGGRMLVDLRITLGKCFQVHRMVCEVFMGLPTDKKEVNHKDGDTRNNNLENLEYVTASENMKHAFENGLRYKKEIPKFKETRDQIFQLKVMGLNQYEIADKLKINQSHVSRTLNNKTYKSIYKLGALS